MQQTATAIAYNYIMHSIVISTTVVHKERRANVMQNGACKLAVAIACRGVLTSKAISDCSQV